MVDEVGMVVVSAGHKNVGGTRGSGLWLCGWCR